MHYIKISLLCSLRTLYLKSVSQKTTLLYIFILKILLLQHFNELVQGGKAVEKCLVSKGLCFLLV